MMATVLNGPPLPPLIFIGRAIVAFLETSNWHVSAECVSAHGNPAGNSVKAVLQV